MSILYSTLLHIIKSSVTLSTNKAAHKKTNTQKSLSIRFLLFNHSKFSVFNTNEQKFKDIHLICSIIFYTNPLFQFGPTRARAQHNKLGSRKSPSIDQSLPKVTNHVRSGWNRTISSADPGDQWPQALFIIRSRDTYNWHSVADTGPIIIALTFISGLQTVDCRELEFSWTNPNCCNPSLDRLQAGWSTSRIVIEKVSDFPFYSDSKWRSCEVICLFVWEQSCIDTRDGFNRIVFVCKFKVKDYLWKYWSIAYKSEFVYYSADSKILF